MSLFDAKGNTNNNSDDLMISTDDRQLSTLPMSQQQQSSSSSSLSQMSLPTSQVDQSSSSSSSPPQPQPPPLPPIDVNLSIKRSSNDLSIAYTKIHSSTDSLPAQSRDTSPIPFVHCSTNASTSYVNTLFSDDDEEIDDDTSCCVPDDVMDNSVNNNNSRIINDKVIIGNVTAIQQPNAEAFQSKDVDTNNGANGTNGDTKRFNSFAQSSTRSNDTVLRYYKSQYTTAKRNKTDEYRLSHPNRPSDAAWKQQKLPAWQPRYRLTNVVVSFVGFGALLLAVGIYMLVCTNKLQEITIDYTYCMSKKFTNYTCAEVLQKKLYLDGKAQCQCEVSVQVPEPIESPVYLYYSLHGFYQNHRRYTSSVDFDQLLGKDVSLKSLHDNCDPFATYDDKPIAPCGAIANSFFYDRFQMFMLLSNSRKSRSIDIKETDICWPTDKEKRYHNPPNGFNWTHLHRPPNWTMRIDELDPQDMDNNGYQNEHFIVWMRTAAFPTFRKLWGRIMPLPADDPLPAGQYRFDIDYNFLSVSDKLEIPKKLIISNTSWLGGKNLFLPILYIVVGGLSILLGLLFFIFVYFFKRKLIKTQIEPHEHMLPTSPSTLTTSSPQKRSSVINNYQTMSTTSTVTTGNIFMVDQLDDD